MSGDNRELTPERYIDVKQMDHQDKTQLQVIKLQNTISKGEIKIIIEKEYLFLQALQALEKTKTTHARGKSVVVIHK
ncbi:MAG: hypothetical protein ACOH2V_01430 [Candidatus Saccharimonadaceae bacterium]